MYNAETWRALEASVDTDIDQGCAWLPHLGALHFTGTDALTFLQGYLTCDTEKLQPDALTATALCNLKGRVVANGWAYVQTDATKNEAQHVPAGVTLLLHRSLTGMVIEFLRKYLAFAKTEVLDLSSTWVTLACERWDAPDTSSAQRMTAETMLVTGPANELQTLWETSPRMHSQRLHLAWLRRGIYCIDGESSERFLPQMLGLHDAIDFTKGCYLGQEVVARAQHRGSVKRKAVLLRFCGADPAPNTGAIVTAQEGRGSAHLVDVCCEPNQSSQGLALAVANDGMDWPQASNGHTFEFAAGVDTAH